MKIDRLLAILMLLINKKKVTASELADYFEVSVRTIQRDMDTLNMAGIPIYADVGKNGGYQLLDNFKLNKSFLNQKEANMLVSFLKNLEETVPYSEVRSVLNKFSALHPEENEQESIVIRLNPFIDDKHIKKIFNNISKARDNQQKLKITYMDLNHNRSERIVCPYTLVMMGSVWYVFAYCELRDDFRIFKLSRIVDCCMLDERFELMDLPKELPWDRSLDSQRESDDIVLELDKKLLGRIPEYFSYNDCEILEDKIIVRLNYPVDEWLYSLFASLIPYIRIVSPQWLKEEFKSKLQEALSKNI